LPNVVLYIPQKDLFANLIGTFEPENIILFIDRAIKGKVPVNTVGKISITNRRCEDIQERPQETFEDDDIMKEMMEERRRMEEEQAKAKALENEGKSKKKKKKKKVEKEDL
jgi:hypothetical protein